MNEIEVTTQSRARSMFAGAALVLSFLAPGLLGDDLAFAVTGPARINYQGVLRDQNDNPLSGTFDMVFHFMDAETLGNEILVDQHLTAAGLGVTVAGGLFNVVLGSGTLMDGSGPGTYALMSLVFRDFGSVWLEVQVGGETLAPRTRFLAAPYAINATSLGGFNDYIRSNPGYFQDITSPLSVSTTFPISFLGQGGGTGILGIGDAIGVEGIGNSGAGAFGGYFNGMSGTGVYATGNVAVDAVGTAIGVQGIAQGIAPAYGGRFEAPNDTGLYATGTVAGLFEANIGNARAYLATSSAGIDALGYSYGGYFSGTSGYGVFATGNIGIVASGANFGGYFSNGAPWNSETYIPYNDIGIRARATYAGGLFEDVSSSNYAYAGYSTYKVYGTGAVSFVQNHPADPDRVIAYAAPEGDEVAVYTRGSGRLVNGEARVALGETFALVTNPDIGLTATATPRGEPIPLAVAEVGPTELVVRGPAGSHAAFDYMVWGLRIGFEEQSIVQPKKDDSKIPAMRQHERFFGDDPALRGYTALARFRGTEEKVHGRRTVDLSRATALRDAIGVFPWHEPGSAPPPHAPGGPGSGPPAPAVTLAPFGPADSGTADESRAPDSPRATLRPEDRFSAPELDLFAPAGTVEDGDVVSLATGLPGAVVRSAGPTDALVIGCARTTGGGAELAEADARDAEAPLARQVAVATGRIALCRVDASFGAVAAGDLLSPSPVEGTAMRRDPDLAGATILGRAIEPLESGTRLVRVLLEVR